MRSTIEIIADLKDGKMPEYEELRMTCLVQNTLMFFARNNIKRLLKGGIGAKVTANSFPDKYGEMGISIPEWNALRMDPFDFLGVDHIPGTQEWKENRKVFNKILERFDMKDRKDDTE